MHRVRTRRTTLFALTAAVGLAAGCAGGRSGRTPIYAAAPGGGSVGERVGVFDRAAVLVAFYGSERQAAETRALIRERDEARARGDARRVRELEAEGSARQDHAHRQLAGEAPLDNIGAALAEGLDRVARDAGVSTIVPEGAQPRGAETIDLTDRIVALMPPAQRKGATP